LSSSLSIAPVASLCQERTDYFGNRATHLVVNGPHIQLLVEAKSLLELQQRPDPRLAEDMNWEAVVEDIQRRHADLHVQEMRFSSPYIEPWDDLCSYARVSFSPRRDLLSACSDLMARIHRDFVYDPSATTVATPLSEVFARRRGVCQDFAHLMVACLRGLGLSARYVSGYLVTDPPLGQARMVGVDASHAWLAVFLPRIGFVDMDPTNNTWPNGRHLTLALGRDFGDVTPMRGVILGGGRHEVEVAVDVTEET
jgi:transglutaminase-like putative cysteine protease